MRMLLPTVSHFPAYVQGCSKEIYHDMIKRKVFVVLKRESRLEVGKQEDSIVGENRRDYKKGSSERIAARGIKSRGLR